MNEKSKYPENTVPIEGGVDSFEVVYHPDTLVGKWKRIQKTVRFYFGGERPRVFYKTTESANKKILYQNDTLLGKAMNAMKKISAVNGFYFRGEDPKK